MGRLRYSIPNSFTALSLLLGLGSIVTTQIGDLEFAAWLIVWCGLLDTMDGLAARLLKATSDFGAEFDSMADLVSFGVAPAVLIFNVGLQIAGVELETGQFWVLLVSCGVFVLAGAMRLARFNLATDKPRTGWFTGVPITAAALRSFTSASMSLQSVPADSLYGVSPSAVATMASMRTPYRSTWSGSNRPAKGCYCCNG